MNISRKKKANIPYTYVTLSTILFALLCDPVWAVGARVKAQLYNRSWTQMCDVQVISWTEDDFV